MTSPAASRPGLLETNRVEAFSDGVFAIAVTLLVLDLRVPDGAGSLAAKLGHQWPSYAAYAVSFLVIGIIWVNHHTVFGNVRAVVYSVTMLLMSVGFIVLWLTVTRERAGLLHEHLRPRQARSALRRFGIGLFAYAAITGLAVVTAVGALVAHGLLALYYCFDQLSGGTGGSDGRVVGPDRDAA